MDYVATGFSALDDLASPIAERIRRFLAPIDPGEAWADLTKAHNDRAAALLAVCHALNRFQLDQGGGRSISGLDMTVDVVRLAGDRAYFVLDSNTFEAWRRSGGGYTIALADETTESGEVHFNGGGFGGSLHPGFSVQGITSNTKVPRMQWNYRDCDRLADIDIDRYHPWDVFHHLSYANSDPRQWYPDFLSKFGEPGFQVQRVGNVDPDEVDLGIQCPRPDQQPTPDEIQRARELARAFDSRLQQTGDFRATVDALADRDLVDAQLADPDVSVLSGALADRVLRSAPRDELHGDYTARATVQWQQIQSAFMVGVPDRRTPSLDISAMAAESASGTEIAQAALALPVETVEQLAEARRRLERAVVATEPSAAVARSLQPMLPASEDTPIVWLAGAVPGTPMPRTIVTRFHGVTLMITARSGDLVITAAMPWL